MKAIIQICGNQHKKSELDFMDELLFLKICGKMMIGYYFDFLYQLGVKEVYIASGNNQALEEKMESTETLNLDIKYINSSTSVKSYIDNFEQFKDEELIIIENFGFIKNNFNHIDSNFFESSQNCCFIDNDFKIYYIKNHTKGIYMHPFEQKSYLDVKQIKTIDDYCLITNLILEKLNELFFLKGYSNEKGIVIGKNVEIQEECLLFAPLIIMDNVKVCKGSILGPNTVLSQNVFVEQNCTISESVVYSNTYVNKNLKLDYKIILSNLIVDKNNKKVYNIDTKFISINSMSLLNF